MARKRKPLPLIPQVTITDVAAEGKALARVGDMVVFVPYVVPGDVVDLRDGVLYVNDQPEAGTYFQGETRESDGIVQYPYRVEEGKYFLVGDNREVSQDSRAFGALPKSSIKGKLLFY